MGQEVLDEHIGRAIGRVRGSFVKRVLFIEFQTMVDNLTPNPVDCS